MPTSVVPVSVERELRRSGVLIREGEFGELSKDQIREIKGVIDSSGGGVSISQAMLVRESALTGQIITSFGDAVRFSDQINRSVGSTPILQLSCELNMSPIVIMITVMQYRYDKEYPGISQSARNHLLKRIIENRNVHSCRESLDILSHDERCELRTAQKNDVIVGASFYVYTLLNQQLAADWENKLYHHLRNKGIVFFNEEEAVQ
ncbi:hypothetical protein ACHAWO_007473 [Cyclotella atomus]|uniref:Uncharacterized protein n=1 Tax=Cyclotella atomus TaxID=382360 RepID=A0ABD3PMJ7_9STRA